MYERNRWGVSALLVLLAAALSAGAAGAAGERRGGVLPEWVQEAKSQQRQVAAAAKEPAAAKPIVIDCSKNGLQAAIDGAKGGDTIALNGICHENVRVDGKRLTLIATTDAGAVAPHGIAGTLAGLPSLRVSHSSGFVLDGLAISGGAGAGIQIDHSQAAISNCEVNGNGATGIALISTQATISNCEVSGNVPGNGVLAVDATNLFATDVQIRNNSRNGFFGARATTAFCDRCDIEDNGGWQGGATFQSLVSIRDSVVSGTNGELATVNSYIDLDCTSIDTGHPCSLTAIDRAGLADSESVMSFYGSGDFWGSFQAFTNSTINLWGARQQALGTNPSNLQPRINYFDIGSTLASSWWSDEYGVPQASRIAGETVLSAFSHGVIYGDLQVAGSIGCDSGADLFADGAQVYEPGGSITGCPTYSPPGP
jgi:parallel beta-helix repeat protein